MLYSGVLKVKNRWYNNSVKLFMPATIHDSLEVYFHMKEVKRNSVAVDTYKLPVLEWQATWTCQTSPYNV